MRQFLAVWQCPRCREHFSDGVLARRHQLGCGREEEPVEARPDDDGGVDLVNTMATIAAATDLFNAATDLFNSDANATPSAAPDPAPEFGGGDSGGGGASSDWSDTGSGGGTDT